MTEEYAACQGCDMRLIGIPQSGGRDPQWFHVMGDWVTGAVWNGHKPEPVRPMTFDDEGTLRYSYDADRVSPGDAL